MCLVISGVKNIRVPAVSLRRLLRHRDPQLEALPWSSRSHLGQRLAAAGVTPQKPLAQLQPRPTPPLLRSLDSQRVGPSLRPLYRGRQALAYTFPSRSGTCCSCCCTAAASSVPPERHALDVPQSATCHFPWRAALPRLLHEHADRDHPNSMLLSQRSRVPYFHRFLPGHNLPRNFFGMDCTDSKQFPDFPHVRNTHGVGAHCCG